MIRALAFLLVLTGAAQAGAWEEFERRCLVPMENVEAPILDDLKFFEQSNLEGKVFELETGLINHFVDPTTGSQRCMLFVLGDWSLEALETGVSMFERLASNGRYTSEHNQFGELELLSTEWREPKLLLHISRREGRTLILAQETDLES